jgi:SAM-dependent methyltransferase
VTLLHAASVLTSALLLFLVEPMVAKAVLPLYGGSPAVWNTCLLFFQGLLLVGYAWAHFGARLLGHRGQLAVQALLVLAPLALLPPHVPTSGPTAGAWPVPALLGALTIAVGLPFFVLATNASLVQKWHAMRTGNEPYFLYAASNAGSFVSLLAYPFLVEPRAGLQSQLRGWSIGYGLFVVLTLVAIAAAWRARTVVDVTPHPAVSRRQRARWVIRAAVPSSLLLAISLRITTDVAAMPLLWVVPLAIYLATFIIAFWPRAPYPRRFLVVLMAVLIAIALGIPDLGRGVLSLALSVPLLLLLLGCWICHADLARDRPAPEHVTEYYLWIAVGGFLGGVFGNLIAPLAFSSIAEFPLTLAAVALLISQLGRIPLWRVAATAVPFIGWAFFTLRGGRPLPGWDWIPLVLLLGGLALWRVPSQFAAACVCAALVNAFGVFPGGRTLEARRSFFGVARVRQSGVRRRLVHGTTLHGMQITEPLNPHPLLYYDDKSPLAQSAMATPDGAHLAVVGLGTGSIAAFVRPGQSLTYYELDPIIEPLARRWFTFMNDCKGKLDVQLGDARLTLKDAPDSSIDFLMVDAFSSDAIPVHLMTVEAMQLYLTKLKPDGVVVFHISNRHLDLAPVLRAIAHKLGLADAYMDYDPDDVKRPDLASVEAVALSRGKPSLQKLYDLGWEPLGDGREVLWTDDRSSLLAVLAE